MKTYKFKYSTVAKCFLFTALVLCVLGLGWNIFNLVQFAVQGVDKIISYGIIILLIAFLIFIILSMCFHSVYYVKNTSLICCIGIFKNTFDVFDITEIVLFKEQNKLVAYFSNGKFTVIVIDGGKYNEFVENVRQVNKKAVFTEQDKEKPQAL